VLQPKSNSRAIKATPMMGITTMDSASTICTASPEDSNTHARVMARNAYATLPTTINAMNTPIALGFMCGYRSR
jgi:hypothetical protein